LQHPAVVLGIGIVIGWLLALTLGAQRRQLRALQALREKERQEADKALVRVKRELDDTGHRWNEQSDLFLHLPELISQLFAASGQREIGPLALGLIERLLEPDQAAVLVVRPGTGRLVLVASRGLPATLPTGMDVEYRGRLSDPAVAEPGQASDDRFARIVDVRQHLTVPGLAGLRTDAVSALADGEQLLGILTVGGSRKRKAQEKQLLAMVGDLASAAMAQKNRVRVTEDSASRDGLTGVYNRPYLLRRLEEELPRAAREGTFVSVLLLDLDYFQHYNRTNGTVEGDNVLRRIGEILQGRIRRNDIAARFGGEEFVVAFLGAGKELALGLAENLRGLIETHPFPHRQHQPLGAVTVSGGVATFPEDAKATDVLIRCADEALLDAKRAGRNRIVAATPSYLE
jgi:diguanylate cyclase (GGDEF)-like protein